MWKRNNSFDMDNIDVTFDFTSDTPYYWDGFWNNELGYSKSITSPWLWYYLFLVLVSLVSGFGITHFRLWYLHILNT